MERPAGVAVQSLGAKTAQQAARLLGQWVSAHSEEIVSQSVQSGSTQWENPGRTETVSPLTTVVCSLLAADAVAQRAKTWDGSPRQLVIKITFYSASKQTVVLKQIFCHKEQKRGVKSTSFSTSFQRFAQTCQQLHMPNTS